jgi:hypothetical protein
MKQEVMTLVPWLVAVYAAICAVVYFGNRLFMYFPNPTRAAPAEAGLDHVKESRSQPLTGSRWLPGTRRRGATGRPSFTSMAMRQTPPIARPELN